jgi:hypothetical protein
LTAQAFRCRNKWLPKWPSSFGRWGKVQFPPARDPLLLLHPKICPWKSCSTHSSYWCHSFQPVRVLSRKSSRVTLLRLTSIGERRSPR